MGEILEKAKLFFDALDTGKGWDGCSAYCHTDATFGAQAGALAEIKTIEAYSEWMKGLFTPVPNGSYEVKFFAEDEERGNVAVYGIFHGTHTGQGGPIEPTGKSTSSDYVYVMDFEDGKIRHMTKIWNDTHALQQLGWA